MSVMATVHASEASALEIEPAERRKVPTAPNPHAATLAVLKAAEAWLSDPKRWTQGTFSRDAEGNALGAAPFAFRDRRKCVHSTCAEGAIRLFAPTGGRAAGNALEAELDGSIPGVNDNDPDAYQKIMAAYRRVITKLEQAA